MKVLILEDEPELNNLATEYLRTTGHQVWSAASLQEAVDVLEEINFDLDLIIADKRLPDGEGTDFALEVREKLPEIKIAMVSGFLTNSERQVLEKENIRCYSKPLLYSKVIKDAMGPPPIQTPGSADAEKKEDKSVKISRNWKPTFLRSKN